MSSVSPFFISSLDFGGAIELCYLRLLEAIFMPSKAEVIQCSRSTLMADSAVGGK